ncbi:hypothetical protein B0H11DRAFT_1992946 [Mycena galericulata]|nr:hypothetical protein B0H11DRAFT_2093264 [Mycena galericulata]KAJ7458669.1 hypothetical protein B0H11DRAFT_2061313 [Mycena galericulata]KAJ7501378.1 hypothetical protein B0H11DRAFT_1992946 [Mycena galericulata]
MIREHQTPPPTPHLDIPPFCPRTQQTRSIRRFSHRAALFYGIHSRLPPCTSRAACARYRLSRKMAAVVPDAPDTTMRLTQFHTQLSDLHKLLTFLTPFPPPSPMSSTSPMAHPASVTSLDMCTTLISFPEASSSSSTPLQGPSEARCEPSRPFVDFGGNFGG